jgi:hypothetical protein
MDPVIFHPEDAIWTILYAPPAEHALVMVHRDAEFRRDTSNRHVLTLPMTGSPARGMLIFSTSGSIIRIAASSLEI